MAEVAAWLARHKDYPRNARRRRQEGTGVLTFVMDRDGRVLEARLARSSGHDALDSAILEMISRAEPLPRIPQGMGAARLELSVPVSFELR
jgi:protein TonB